MGVDWADNDLDIGGKGKRGKDDGGKARVLKIDGEDERKLVERWQKDKERDMATAEKSFRIAAVATSVNIYGNGLVLVLIIYFFTKTVLRC